MAQVKVQTSAPLAGPGLSPGVSPTAMASPGPLGLQPSVNGTGPAPTPACPAPAVGYGDAPVSATSPGKKTQQNSLSFTIISSFDFYIVLTLGL